MSKLAGIYTGVSVSYDGMACNRHHSNIRSQSSLEFTQQNDLPLSPNTTRFLVYIAFHCIVVWYTALIIEVDYLCVAVLTFGKLGIF